VDDLLLFCKADGSSVKCLMAPLGHFTVVTGLEINPAKSHLVLAGISEQTSSRLLSLTGVQEGTMPFKYLGAPIKPQKLSKDGCQVLVEKIVCKIRACPEKSYLMQAELS